MAAGLKAAERALNPAKALKLLRETSAGSRWEIARVRRIETVKYRPGRRLTLRYTVDARRAEEPLCPRTLYGKAYRGHGGERVHRALSHLRPLTAEPLRLPEPLGYSAGKRFLLLEAIEGSPLTRLLGAALWHDHLCLFGRALAAFHDLPVGAQAGDLTTPEVPAAAASTGPPLRVHDADSEIEVLAMARDRLGVGSIPEDLAGRFLEAYGRTKASLREHAGTGVQPRRRIIHRDLYPEQVFVTEGRIGLIDLDELARGEPELDVGNFIAHLMLGDLQALGTVGPALPQAQSLIASYCDVLPLSAQRLVAYTAAALLRLASLDRVARPDVSLLARHDLADALVRESERILDHPWPYRPQPSGHGLADSDGRGG